MTTELLVPIESVRTPRVRDSSGGLAALADSIRTEGLRHPIVLWKDGTLLSGFRVHRALMLIDAKTAPAVFVDTVEDAAKLMLIRHEDDHLALPMKWSEVCRLWQTIRHLDEPAAAVRAEAARRRGVELRRQTFKGKRDPGRTIHHSEDYVLSVLAPAFDTSESTARRLWAIYAIAFGLKDAPDAKREQAQRALAAIDVGDSSISANYQRLVANRPAPPAHRPAPVAVPSAAAKVQLSAWDKALPQMEGLVAGLTALGPPNPELTWEQVGPVHTRLMVVRRELEKMINKMKGTNQS